jgi:hypothetical protein
VKKLLFILMLLVPAALMAQEEETVISSCSLFVKATALLPAADAPAGIAIVEASLCDQDGAPISGQPIELTSSVGELTCQPPAPIADTISSTFQSACSETGLTGKTVVYLIGVPFNTQGRIKASCTYGEISASASSSFLIKRSVVKKKGTRR